VRPRLPKAARRGTALFQKLRGQNNSGDHDSRQGADNDVAHQPFFRRTLYVLRLHLIFQTIENAGLWTLMLTHDSIERNPPPGWLIASSASYFSSVLARSGAYLI